MVSLPLKTVKVQNWDAPIPNVSLVLMDSLFQLNIYQLASNIALFFKTKSRINICQLD